MDVEDRMTTKSKLDTVQLNNVLFHGSSIENWYSIIRNGLKITSKTALMTTGSAYGVGLYFSNDVNLSYSYSKVMHHGFLGVYQIYDDMNKYKKTENIFVVNDEQIVLLRYLIYFSKPMDQKTGAEIQKYFQSMVKPSVTKARFDIGSRRLCEALCEDTSRHNALSESIVPKKVSTGGLTKILKEYKEITQKKLGFNVEIQNENMFAWHVMISEFDEKFPIAIDMKKYKVKEIQLEILFPSNYPFHPPFVRILNPRFKYQTGHITSEGAICMELLTPSGWTPIQSIESLLIQIKALIIEGDGRLDEKRWNQPYSLAEAKKSFERVARGHGWLK
jgi:ubiquitin-protein ligase